MMIAEAIRCLSGLGPLPHRHDRWRFGRNPGPLFPTESCCLRKVSSILVGTRIITFRARAGKLEGACRRVEPRLSMCPVSYSGQRETHWPS